MTRNLTNIRELDVDSIDELLSLAKDYKKRIQDRKPVPNMREKVVGLLFFENSTRTRVSFEQAANYLNLRSCNFTSGGSSMSKGESLKDTILTLRHERLDGLVMRHKASGSPNLAVKHFHGPVWNAGDGQHEHPTQALADALTIIERKGTLNVKVAIVGDVKHSRVARSNAWLLSKMGADVHLVGPKTLLPSHTGMIPGTFHNELAEGIQGADVVICLRLQRERMTEGLISSTGEYASLYQINSDTLKFAKPNCTVMHPGPINRGIEVDDAAADGECSAIHDQVENGIFVRMASYVWSFGGHA